MSHASELDSHEVINYKTRNFGSLLEYWMDAFLTGFNWDKNNYGNSLIHGMLPEFKWPIFHTSGHPISEEYKVESSEGDIIYFRICYDL